MAEPVATSSDDVFINCPFDPQYKEIFEYTDFENLVVAWLAEPGKEGS